MGRQERGEWLAKARSDPKGAMEADLIVAAVGVFIIVMGGLVAVAGVHPRWQSIQNNSPISQDHSHQFHELFGYD